MLNEWREKFSEILGIYTKPSYKDRPLRKTVFSISLGRSLYTGLTVLNSVSPTTEVKNLGVTFNSGNTFASHITKVCRSC